MENSLPLNRRHALAARALREGGPYDHLGFPPLPATPEGRSHRYHEHLAGAGLSVKEHNLLITTQDIPSSVPYLPLAIYLDHIRSAHNVGSIIRTTEALRLGTLILSPNTPGPDNKKVRDAAMGTEAHVPFGTHLPRPWIALETALEAPSLFDYPFPSTFTLILGNEEFGISESLLKQCDLVVTIPLVGSKNSLNVACAYSLAAGVIAHQLRT